MMIVYFFLQIFLLITSHKQQQKQYNSNLIYKNIVWYYCIPNTFSLNYKKNMCFWSRWHVFLVMIVLIFSYECSGFVYEGSGF